MIYLVCFLFSFLTLTFLIARVKRIDLNAVMLCAAVVIGNGGYYALYDSQNLSEAILANKITYVIGSFAPMIMFLIICNICRINVSTKLQTFLYSIQILIFLSVCTSGKLPIFYKTIEYCTGSTGAYLNKTYGPMHTVYIISMCFYMVASIAVVGDSLRKKRCRVSDSKANILLFLFLVSAIVYFVERFINMNFELMPIIFTITNFFVIIIFINISCYSAYGNLSILEDKNDETAYIVFNKKIMFMSCNDYALELFPELSSWEIEKVIPGSGGRFNTFLRLKFMNYVESKNKEKQLSSFEFDNKVYRVEISNLLENGKTNKGYVIEVARDLEKK